MKKIIECTITEEIVKNTTFLGFVKPCYAIQAIMDATGFSQKAAGRIYLDQVSSILADNPMKSACGNTFFSEDLMSLDDYPAKVGLFKRSVPKLPLTFKIEI